MLEQGDLTSAPVEWEQPDYWDEQSLDKELRRQYDVCNSCRLCFNLCPGFPKLFEHFDAVDHEPDKLTGEQVGEFVDLCYNCKLCFIKCPYTPPHKFLIDIPKVVMRARAIEEKKNGLDLREKMLSSPDEIGPLGSRLAPLANAANENKLNRVLMEKFVGIHRDKILPKFHAQTFERWFKKKFGQSQPTASTNGKPKVALFHTCIVNYNEPNIGKAAVAVLQHNGCEVVDPAGQNCCGMPYLDSGKLEVAVDHFRNNMSVLLPYVRQGYDIVIPEPTCGLLMKKEYYDYLRDEEREQAVELSKHVFDLSEYLVKLKAEGRLDRDWKVKIGKVAYHQPCHLKYHAIGNKSLELLRLVGAEVIFIDKGCSGHDGMWAAKKEYFDLAQKVAGKLQRGVTESQADLVATDCSLAGLQIQQGTGRETIHPVEVVAKAYGIEIE